MKTVIKIKRKYLLILLGLVAGYWFGSISLIEILISGIPMMQTLAPSVSSIAMVIVTFFMLKMSKNAWVPIVSIHATPQTGGITSIMIANVGGSVAKNIRCRCDKNSLTVTDANGNDHDLFDIPLFKRITVLQKNTYHSMTFQSENSGGAITIAVDYEDAFGNEYSDSHEIDFGLINEYRRFGFEAGRKNTD